MHFRNALFVAALAAVPGAAFAAVVVPNDYTNVAGTTTFAGPLSRFARTYQLLVDDTQLSSVIGHQITGVTWRLRSTVATSWPATDAVYDDFDIYLSGSVEPSARSLTLADNIVGAQTQVRNGPMTIPANSFTSDGTLPSPFGAIINFDTPFTYTGGNLLLEMRQSAHSATDRSVDAIGTSAPGYGTAVSAAWGSGNTAVTGLAGNAIVTQFITVVPEPTSLAVMFSAAPLLCRRRAARR